MSKKYTISFCSIVKNEAQYLSAMLDSIINIADEIIIVDTGSTDDTLEIIKSYKLKPYFYQWDNDFSKARNYALSQATKDWIFNIDADERLIVKADINDSLALKDHAYMLQIKNVLMGGKEYFYSSYTRLFPNFSDFYFKGEVHEYVTREKDHDKSIIKNIELIHLGYNKINENKKYRNINILKKKFLNYQDKDNDYYHNKYLIGKEYFTLNDFENGLEAYLEYINSDFGSTNVNLANAVTDIINLYYHLNRFDEMIECLEKYGEIGLSNPDFCIYYGDYISNIDKDYQKAIFYYQKALYFKPMNNPGISYTQSSIDYYPCLMIGINYLKLQKYNQAVNYLKKAVAINPTSKALYNLVIALYQIDKEKAQEIFNSNINVLSQKEIKDLRLLLF